MIPSDEAAQCGAASGSRETDECAEQVCQLLTAAVSLSEMVGVGKGGLAHGAEFVDAKCLLLIAFK